MTEVVERRVNWRVGEYGRIERDFPEQTWRQWRDVYADSVIYEGPGPFSGLTIAKAELITETLYGFPVRVLTHNDRDQGRGGSFGIFLGIELPGGWRPDPLTVLGDMRVLNAYPSERMFATQRVGGGSTRVMSPGAVLEFDVIAPEAWIECNYCGGFRPRSQLRHVWRYTEDWTPEDFECNWPFEWVCRKQGGEWGYCL